jgi:co-chaperonin GroES (HSP10)
MIKPGSTPIYDPMPGKIVVQAIVEERYGSLHLPTSSGGLRVLGTVVAIGRAEDEDEEDLPLEVGDTVLFGAHSGVRVRIGVHEVLFFRISEILSKISWKEPEEPVVQAIYDA